MFELLLIIYLLPVLIIGMLLLKLVFWLLRIVIRFAVWLVKKTFILIWKLIVFVFAIIIGREIMPWNQPDKQKEPHQYEKWYGSETNGLISPICSNLESLAFASDIYCFFLRITVCQSELYITSYGDVIRKLIGKC